MDELLPSADAVVTACVKSHVLPSTTHACLRKALLPRRDFLAVSSGSVTLALTSAARAPAEEDAEVARPSWEAPDRIIDVNVYLSSWPFRKLEYDELPRLVDKLRSHRVVQAWAGSFDALLHRDLRAVNARLVAACRAGAGLLLPFPAINPKQPDWTDDLRQVVEEFRAAGIRLHPDYHGYGLDDPDFIELVHKAAQAKLIVQLVLMAEDERTVHPAVKIPMVDPKPLVDVVRQVPGLYLVLLNAQRVTPLPLLAKIVAAGQVYVDISWQEGVAGVVSLLNHVPAERILFGSYFPRFYFLSALLKLRESAIAGQILSAITYDNPRSLLVRRSLSTP